MKRRIISVFMTFVLLFALTNTAMAASGGNAAASSRSGVARVLALYELYLGDESLGVTFPAVGSSFGVGKAGKETDIFVTNRHVVADTQKEWSTYDLIYYIQGEEGLRSYAAQYENQTVLVNHKLTRAYLLRDDYAYSDDTGLDSSRSVPCDIIYMAGEKEPDLAVLRAAEPVEGRTALPLAPAENGGVEPGDTVYALGYPVSADAATTDERLHTDYAGSVESVTITTGVVSRFVDYSSANARIIQHDAAINGGNSGGPLINEKGAVLLARKRRSAPQPAGVPASGPAPAQELRVQGQSGAFAGRRFAINGQVRIGRDPGGNDLVYPDGTPGISGRHCVVTLSGGQVTLTDLGSSYGTFLSGGRKLAPNQPMPLRMGDRFYLGSEKESFVITGKGGSLT